MANMTFDQWAEKTEHTLDQVSRVIKIKLFTGIIMDTRVDTGRMRGNWQTSTGSPKLIETSNTDQISIGQAGGKAYEDVIDGVTSGVDYLTNNVPYVAFWEQHDGMVAKNILRIQSNIKKILRDAG
tara:strand:+ start:64 stop:441 length:378 start_codon:yes stop_codon:yes gene_type:complete